MKKWIALLLALLCLPTAFAAGLPVMEGGIAPDFEVRTLDRETFRLSDQRGKVVMINIWATWCGPCVSEMPEIDRLAKDYADQLVVIGINAGEPEAAVAEFVEKNGYSYLFAADENYAISGDLYPSNGIPYTVIVDPEGKVSKVHMGGGPHMYNIFKTYVDEALKASKTINGVELLA